MLRAMVRREVDNARLPNVRRSLTSSVLCGPERLTNGARPWHHLLSLRPSPSSRRSAPSGRQASCVPWRPAHAGHRNQARHGEFKWRRENPSAPTPSAPTRSFGGEGQDDYWLKPWPRVPAQGRQAGSTSSSRALPLDGKIVCREISDEDTGENTGGTQHSPAKRSAGVKGDAGDEAGDAAGQAR